jgi:hypothetical protein
MSKEPKQPVPWLLREQAAKRNGNLENCFFCVGPKLLFNHSGYDFEVWTNKGDDETFSGEYTHARCKFRLSRDIKMAIYPKNFLATLFKFVGMPAMEIGNPDFDNTFIIKTKDESFARKLLTPELQRSLLSLKAQGLKITSGTLHLNILGPPEYTSVCDQLIDTAISLVTKIGSIEHIT